MCTFALQPTRATVTPAFSTSTFLTKLPHEPRNEAHRAKGTDQSSKHAEFAKFAEPKERQLAIESALRWISTLPWGTAPSSQTQALHVRLGWEMMRWGYETMLLANQGRRWRWFSTPCNALQLMPFKLQFFMWLIGTRQKVARTCISDTERPNEPKPLHHDVFMMLLWCYYDCWHVSLQYYIHCHVWKSELIFLPGDSRDSPVAQARWQRWSCPVHDRLREKRGNAPLGQKKARLSRLSQISCGRGAFWQAYFGGPNAVEEW